MKDLEIIYAMLSEKHSLDTSYRKVLFLGTGNKNINEKNRCINIKSVNVS
jgi:hypothetical protein